jgi:hypothetical protein
MITRKPGFARCLLGCPADSRNPDKVRIFLHAIVNGLRTKFENGFKEGMFGFPDFKLGGVNPDCDSTRASFDIVACQGALVAFVPFSIFIKSQGHRRYYQAARKMAA